MTSNFKKILEPDELPEGRVTTVNVGRQTLAVSHYDGQYGCLGNECPHQGGPLGEGSIEHGQLRCPWHGYDYDPITGQPPPPFDDAPEAFPVEVSEDGVYVDVGNNTYSFGRYFEVANQAVLMSGYLGSIGFGFPAAMGAWAAVGGERQVVSVSGDGGFGQYAMELTTAVKYGMNITHVLLNNNELGKISKEQRAGDFDVWQTALVNPGFAGFAEACGAKGIEVTDSKQLDDALRSGLDFDGPALIEVQSDVNLL